MKLLLKHEERYIKNRITVGSHFSIDSREPRGDALPNNLRYHLTEDGVTMNLSSRYDGDNDWVVEPDKKKSIRKAKRFSWEWD